MVISIIITIYKSESNLEVLLESLIKQKASNIEFFLIINGKSIVSSEICKRYAQNDIRFTIVEFEKNIGYIAARNYGITHCKGDYIGFCDSDDYLEENGYEQAIKIISSFCCDMYMTSYNTIYHDKVITKHLPVKNGLYSQDSIESVILPLIYGCTNKSGHIFAFEWKNIFKKEIIKNIVFDKELQPFEDELFNVRAVMNCKTIYVDNSIIYNYVINSNSITSQIETNFAPNSDWMRIELLFNAKKKCDTELKYFTYNCNYSYCLLYGLIIKIAKYSKNPQATFLREVNRNVVLEIINNSQQTSSVIDCFLKWCIKTKQYRLMFYLIKIIFRIKKGLKPNET